MGRHNVIRFILLSAFVFAFPFLQWLGDDPHHAVRPYEPRVTGEVMLYHQEWYKLEDLWRWRAADVTIYTFYSNGNCTVSKGE